MSCDQQRPDPDVSDPITITAVERDIVTPTSELLSAIGAGFTAAGKLMARTQDDAWQKRIPRFVELIVKLAMKAALLDLGLKNGGIEVTFKRGPSLVLFLGEPEFKMKAELKKKVDRCPDEAETKKLAEALEATIDDLAKSLGIKKQTKVGDKEVKQGAVIECDSTTKELKATITAIYVGAEK